MVYIRTNVVITDDNRRVFSAYDHYRQVLEDKIAPAPVRYPASGWYYEYATQTSDTSQPVGFQIRAGWVFDQYYLAVRCAIDGVWLHQAVSGNTNTAEFTVGNRTYYRGSKKTTITYMDEDMYQNSADIYEFYYMQ